MRIVGRTMAVGNYHCGELSVLCHTVKYGTRDVVKAAGDLLATFLEQDCILVPMPSHDGRATYMKDVCEYISKVRGVGEVWDILRCRPHESNYSQKQRCRHPKPIEMWTHSETGDVDFGGRNVYILDNVIGTGTTANAALAALPNAIVFALARA